MKRKVKKQIALLVDKLVKEEFRKLNEQVKNSLILIASNIEKSKENGTLDDKEEDSAPHNNSKKCITVIFDRDYKPKNWKTSTFNIS